MSRKRVIAVVGARPNFMKMAPVVDALRKNEFDVLLVHTGQHYDANMSDVFFSDLEMPKPDVFLGAGGGSHAEQTSKIMIAMEQLFATEPSDLVLVPGDVNSTLATTLVAAKMGRTLGHIESGLRSFDRGMPEEINRIVTDEFSQFLFVTEPSGLENLEKEGIPASRAYFVGNTMIDTLYKYLPKAKERFIELSQKLNVVSLPLDKGRAGEGSSDGYALVTLHRPSNVDDADSLKNFVQMFDEMRQYAKRIVFPIHPRTRKMLAEHGLMQSIEANDHLVLIDPVGYLDFVALQAHARLVLTDSGGIQEETTALGVPCITLRENTERPVTVTEGTNELVGLDRTTIMDFVQRAFEGRWKNASVPKLWDGHASDRIVKILQETL